MWNLSIQRELPGNMMVEIGYVGSHGSHLAGDTFRSFNYVPTADKLKYQNQINAEVPISQYFSGNALALMEQTWGSTQLPLSSMLVPYPLFGNIFSQTVLDAPSSYNAMHVKVQKRFSHGLNFIAVYTWSKEIDSCTVAQLASQLFDPVHSGYAGNIGGRIGAQGSGFASGSSGVFGTGCQNEDDRAADRTISIQDIPQTFNIAGTYELPFGPGRAFLNHSGVASALLGGWVVTGNFNTESGTPLNVTGPCDGLTCRPDLIGDPSLSHSRPKADRINDWINANAFLPLYGSDQSFWQNPNPNNPLWWQWPSPHGRGCPDLPERVRVRLSGGKPSMKRNLVAGALALYGVGFLVSRPTVRGTSADTTSDYSQIFDKRDAMIPTRDGVRLHTEIYTPKHAAESLPFILERTPYGLNDDDKGFSRKLSIYREMIPEGFIFVFQDIRGRYWSEGVFVMFRNPRDKSDPHAIDESTDTNDSVDWLLKNVPNNNGKVGILGISYGGWLTTMALLDPHPAIKAASEQASPADQFLGDDFHHNGAFRLSYGFEYSTEMETGKENYSFQFSLADTFDWYLNQLGPLSNADEKYLHGKVPTWENFVSHPNYDEFWQKQAFAPYLKPLKLAVPNLNVTGWWDQEDFYGPNKIYELLEKNDVNHKNFLVAGPWNHGGWAHEDGSHLGKIQFGSDTSKHFRESIQLPWFTFWLKGRGALPLREALTFETGSNKWVQYDGWPPHQGVSEQRLYMQSGSHLSFAPPPDNGAQACDSYVSDPAYPVPYRHRAISRTYGPVPGWSTWLVEDQRFVYLLPGVVAWQMPTLDHDLTVTGDIVAHLFASTTGSDADWIVKLIDVYPEDYPQEPAMAGYQLMVADEVFRARFRESFEHPAPVTPGRVTEYTVDLHAIDHTFLKGHRIMVQVQSTWFPVIDRNPQKYVPNIYKAASSDYQVATNSIYHSKQYPSYVALPVRVQ